MLYICILSNKFDLNQTIRVSHTYDKSFISQVCGPLVVWLFIFGLFFTTAANLVKLLSSLHNKLECLAVANFLDFLNICEPSESLYRVLKCSIHIE